MKQHFPCSGQESLVSVLIPAFNPKYFEECLKSAVSQSYGFLEILVSDDSPGQEVALIVSRYAVSDCRIKYFRNAQRLGSRENYIRLFSLSSGKYIKFLNDDDLLHPDCVRRMVKCLQQEPCTALVTSHRQVIDKYGNALPDITATRRPVQEDSILDGLSVANAVLERKINFIGEPSTTMFRKEDLVSIRPDLLSFAGRKVLWNCDVVMWLNLLIQGHLMYLTDTLSYFRYHEEQEQQQPVAWQIGMAAWEQLREDGFRIGLLKEDHLPVDDFVQLAKSPGLFTRKRDEKIVHITLDMIDDNLLKHQQSNSQIARINIRRHNAFQLRVKDGGGIV